MEPGRAKIGTEAAKMRDDYMDEMLIDIARDNEVATNLLVIKSKIYAQPGASRPGGQGQPPPTPRG